MTGQVTDAGIRKQLGGMIEDVTYNVSFSIARYSPLLPPVDFDDFTTLSIGAQGSMTDWASTPIINDEDIWYVWEGTYTPTPAEIGQPFVFEAKFTKDGYSIGIDGPILIAPDLGDVADIAIDSVSASENPVIAGTAFSVQVIVSNKGPNDAAVVDAILSVSSQLTEPVTDGCDDDPFSIPDCALLRMPAITDTSFSVDGIVDASFTGDMTFSFEVSSELPDPNPGNETGPIVVAVVAESDLALSKDVDVDMVLPEETVAYQLVVSNLGPSDANNVGVNDVFPSGLTCSWTSISQAGATGNTDGSGAILADILDLPANSTVSYTIPCVVGDSLVGTLVNNANLVFGGTDPDLSNNAASASTIVERLPIDVPSLSIAGLLLLICSLSVFAAGRIRLVSRA